MRYILTILFLITGYCSIGQMDNNSGARYAYKGRIQVPNDTLTWDERLHMVCRTGVYPWKIVYSEDGTGRIVSKATGKDTAIQVATSANIEACPYYPAPGYHQYLISNEEMAIILKRRNDMKVKPVNK
jgi:hypothetical protein